MVQSLAPVHNTDDGDVSVLPQEAKQARQHSRHSGLFAPELLKSALVRSFVMLRPDILWKNPVMFTVEVGMVLSIIGTVRSMLGWGGPAVSYLLALDIWLLLTVLFANFAEALAEARGKAQTEALRKTRQKTPAYRLLDHGQLEETVSTDLRAGDRVVVQRARSSPVTAKSSRAWPPSTSRRSPANRRR
jgi:K+-transporting ATPase ATPase B chain